MRGAERAHLAQPSLLKSSPCVGPRYNVNAGNGIGESQLPRHLGGGSYTAPPPAESHAIVNAYTLAFFDRYLRGEVARDGWLAENHYGDAVVLEAKKR